MLVVKLHAQAHVGCKVARTRVSCQILRARVSCEVARAMMSHKPQVALMGGAVAAIAHVQLKSMRLLILHHLQ